MTGDRRETVLLCNTVSSLVLVLPFVIQPLITRVLVLPTGT